MCFFFLPDTKQFSSPLRTPSRCPIIHFSSDAAAWSWYRQHRHKGSIPQDFQVTHSSVLLGYKVGGFPSIPPQVGNLLDQLIELGKALLLAVSGFFIFIKDTTQGPNGRDAF